MNWFLFQIPCAAIVFSLHSRSYYYQQQSLRRHRWGPSEAYSSQQLGLRRSRVRIRFSIDT
ncbi:hypothetical protein WH5701_11254 [Synechococcus sp. WH 5701]|nr:hypothetical protein WH5701_11254 [Synechococcus sp. WH 5701]